MRRKNIENFLHSLSSFKNIDEIICVDDGSQDHSLDILNLYAHQIKIIHFPIK